MILEVTECSCVVMHEHDPSKRHCCP